MRYHSSTGTTPRNIRLLECCESRRWFNNNQSNYFKQFLQIHSYSTLTQMYYLCILHHDQYYEVFTSCYQFLFSSFCSVCSTYSSSKECFSFISVWFHTNLFQPLVVFSQGFWREPHSHYSWKYSIHNPLA